MDKKMEKLNLQATLMGRRGTAEEVANVYLFLASDEATYVTGAVYTVDGASQLPKGRQVKKPIPYLKKSRKVTLGLNIARKAIPRYGR